MREEDCAFLPQIDHIVSRKHGGNSLSKTSPTPASCATAQKAAMSPPSIRTTGPPVQSPARPLEGPLSNRRQLHSRAHRSRRRHLETPALQRPRKTSRARPPAIPRRLPYPILRHRAAFRFRLPSPRRPDRARAATRSRRLAHASSRPHDRHLARPHLPRPPDVPPSQRLPDPQRLPRLPLAPLRPPRRTHRKSRSVPHPTRIPRCPPLDRPSPPRPKNAQRRTHRDLR